MYVLTDSRSMDTCHNPGVEDKCHRPKDQRYLSQSKSLEVYWGESRGVSVQPCVVDSMVAANYFQRSIYSSNAYERMIVQQYRTHQGKYSKYRQRISSNVMSTNVFDEGTRWLERIGNDREDGTLIGSQVVYYRRCLWRNRGKIR